MEATVYDTFEPQDAHHKIIWNHQMKDRGHPWYICDTSPDLIMFFMSFWLKWPCVIVHELIKSSTLNCVWMWIKKWLVTLRRCDWGLHHSRMICHCRCDRFVDYRASQCFLEEKWVCTQLLIQVCCLSEDAARCMNAPWTCTNHSLVTPGHIKGR